MTKLKPCPFCGGEAKIRWYLNSQHVYCRECRSEGLNMRGLAEAIKAWNTRHTPKPEAPS